jgi:hypothetical protein
MTKGSPPTVLTCWGSRLERSATPTLIFDLAREIIDETELLTKQVLESTVGVDAVVAQGHHDRSSSPRQSRQGGSLRSSPRCPSHTRSTMADKARHRRPRRGRDERGSPRSRLAQRGATRMASRALSRSIRQASSSPCGPDRGQCLLHGALRPPRRPWPCSGLACLLRPCLVALAWRTLP